MSADTGTPAPIFSFPPFQVDVRAAELRKHGVKVRLSKQPFQLLLMLLQQPGEVILREQIQAALWPGGTIVEFDDSINAAVKNIRRALSDSPDTPRFVETVGRQGYRFIGTLECKPAGLLSVEPVSGPRPVPSPPPNFRILKKLGEGAVGQVYLAQDLKLDRPVALKFLSLPPEMVSPQMVERFRREALAAAALSHPNVCTVYGVEESAGRPAIVMEYVEGEALADRLKRGSMPLPQALAVGAQIAAALGEAHRRGIVHRDLKPANIMLGRLGAKVLDFGVARMRDSATPEMPAQTLQGTILGTPQYMSPEQASGGDADSRSDIFSFGAVLYEMLTGNQAFHGSSAVAVMAAVLEGPAPSVAAIAPATLDRLLQRCLAKDPEARWQSALDLKAELDWIATNPGAPAAAPRRRPPRLYYALVAAAILLAALIGFSATAWNRLPALSPRLKVAFDVPDAPLQTWASISPDGSRIAVAGPQGVRIRRSDSVDWRLLPGTVDSRSAMWAPDNRYIVYYLLREAQLKRVDVDSGAIRTLVNTLPNWRGLAWSADGSILYSSGDGSPIWKVSENGGTPAPATAAIGDYPEMLPDGRHFLYLNPDKRMLEAGALDSSATRELAPANSQVRFVPPDRILYVRGTTLLSQRFDSKVLQVLGEPVILAEDVHVDGTKFFADFSVSRNGILLYRSGSVFPTELSWRDRSGKRIRLEDDQHEYLDIALAPDGQRIAVSRRDPSTMYPGLWVIDSVRGVTTRIITEANRGGQPSWSPDGRRLAYLAGQNVYVTASDGSGSPALVANRAAMPNWSPQGDIIYLHLIDREHRGPLRLWSPRNSDPVPYLDGVLAQPAFSPDGRWIAYVKWEHELVEVFVESVPAGHGRWQISSNGGAQPVWRPDGTELFYKSRDGMIVAVPVKTGDTFAAGTPKQLFTIKGFARFEYRRQFQVSPDGQRFLVNEFFPPNPPAFVLENWLR